ncbi:MAG: hypothetical protein ACNA78_03735 [Balneolaceae bacterium]
MLLLSCVATAAIHVSATFHPSPALQSQAQLDELINAVFEEHRLPKETMRIQTVQIDSLFERKIYRVPVAPSHSKTDIHLSLHEKLRPYGVNLYGAVEFPERNLHLHVRYNGTIHRTIIMLNET